MSSKIDTVLKAVIGLTVCIGSRLLPHPPNIEPVMASTMPFARRFGALYGFAFSFAAIAAIDLFMDRLGLWTLYCGIAYGLVGLLAARYFGSLQRVGRRHYVGFAAAATVAYDLVTMLLFAAQFGIALPAAIAGQLPFTLYHLVGNIAFAALLSPLFAMFVVDNPSLTVEPVVKAVESALPRLQ